MTPSPEEFGFGNATDGGWEEVITVGDYYDGPRTGIATFRGKPHAFECQFSREDDDYTDRFLLMELDPKLTKLAVERWAIFLRWSSAFQKGEVSLDYKLPLALPEDRARHEELTALIGDRLKPTADKSILVRGELRRSRGGSSFRWHELPSVPPPSP